MSAELLALSDERDLWGSRLLDTERTAYVLGHADGRADERREADRAWAARPRQRVRDGDALADVEAARWHLCCRPCRLAGHRAGCTDCEDRNRETFGLPSAADYQGQRQEHAA